MLRGNPSDRIGKLANTRLRFKGGRLETRTLPLLKLTAVTEIGQSNAESKLEISDDGQDLLIVAPNGAVALWNRTGDRTALLRPAGSLSHAQFNGTSAEITTVADNRLIETWKPFGGWVMSG